MQRAVTYLRPTSHVYRKLRYNKELRFIVVVRVSLRICKCERDVAGSNGTAADEVPGVEGRETGSGRATSRPRKSGFVGPNLTFPRPGDSISACSSTGARRLVLRVGRDSRVGNVPGSAPWPSRLAVPGFELGGPPGTICRIGTGGRHRAHPRFAE